MSKHVRRIVIVVAALAIALLLIRALARSRELSHRLVCCSNAKGVATALILYGHLIDLNAPDPIGQLIASGQVSAEAGSCPRVQHAYRLNLPVIRARLSELYAPPRMVVVYEDPDNHDGQGGCVVFADGHCSVVAAADMKQVLEDGGVP